MLLQEYQGKYKSMNELKKNRDLIWDIITHILYCLLYGVSIFVSLWKHCHPIYTTVLLILLLPIIVIPFFKILRHQLTRSIMQIIFPMIAGIWLIYRIINRIPSDTFLIETLTMAGYAFAFTISWKDRGYFLLISSILIMYGAVCPRTIYIYMMPIIILLFIIILYSSRREALSNNNQRIPNSSKISFTSCLYLIPQVALMVLLSLLFYVLLPIKDATSKGIFVSSFYNNNINVGPKTLQEWFKSPNVQKGKNGRREVSGLGKFLSKKSNVKVKANRKSNSMGMNGAGSGAPGKELLFTVKSDVKLYWLGALYDRYDGIKWSTSKKMTGQKIVHNYYFAQSHINTIQKFTIKKWNSRTLPSAFIPYYYFLNNSTTIDSTFYNNKFKIGTKYPKLPFVYTTNTYLPFKRSSPFPDINAWWEKIPKEHYLQLPTTITDRLKAKAQGITSNSRSKYEKAMAIRDFLRKNYRYEQFASKVPKGVECVDYFIFQLHAGHCEYFAAAMVILARINNLPARVATGYSPGNYNIMTQQFEVYEYHAHAWAQVFIEDIGWLTFDATPPGRIISKTYPIGIGALKDPFGNEWKVSPPELATYVQNKATPFRFLTNNKNTKSIFKPSKRTKWEQVLLNIPENEEEFRKSISKLKKKMGGDKSFIIRNYKKIKENFKSFINSIVKTWWKLINFFNGINGIVILCMIVLFYPIYITIHAFIIKTKRFIMISRCNNMLNRALKNRINSPDLCIELSYFATRHLLEISGYKNIKKLELFAYGASLKNIKIQLSKDVLKLFSIYTKMAYSFETNNVQDAKIAIKKALKIRTKLKKVRLQLKQSH